MPDKESRQNTSKDMENLNKKISKSDVMGTYTALYPTIKECIHGNL